jgi:hypothetical protein
MRATRVWAAAAFGVAGWCGAAGAASISFDLGVSNIQDNGGDDAGAVSVPGSRWNLGSIAGATETFAAATDDTGGATGVSATFTQLSGGGAQGGSTPGTADNRMLGAHWDLFGGTDASPSGTFSATGIGYAAYDVYVYLAPTNLGSDANRVAGIEINGGADKYLRPATATPTSAAGYVESTFASTPGTVAEVPSAHYVKFSGITGSTLSLDFWGDLNTSVARARIAGVQIVEATPVPEPASLAILGFAGLAMRRRR